MLAEMAAAIPVTSGLTNLQIIFKSPFLIDLSQEGILLYRSGNKINLLLSRNRAKRFVKFFVTKRRTRYIVNYDDKHYEEKQGRDFLNQKIQSTGKWTNTLTFFGVLIPLIALLFGDSIYFRIRDAICKPSDLPVETTVAATTPTYPSIPEVSTQTTEPSTVPSETSKPKRTVRIGEIIRFGQYEQDNNIGNGQESIDWVVLDINGNDALVISRYALDTKPYHSQKVDVSWENCSLRSWLNSTFLNASFSQEESAAIKPVTNAASWNPLYSTDPGNKTEDKVFLLSIDEVIRYMPQNYDRLCQATLYTVGQGAYVNTATAGSWWWLRTPGSSRKDASSVNSDGSIDYDDGTVNSPKGTVRPAMWVDVSMLG